MKKGFESDNYNELYELHFSFIWIFKFVAENKTAETPVEVETPIKSDEVINTDDKQEINTGNFITFNSRLFYFWNYIFIDY